MALASIPVDLLNPGQVFGGLGFAEIAAILHGEARGAFDWSVPGRGRFLLQTPASDDPITAVLAFLEAAEVVSLAPAGSSNRTEKPWKVSTLLLPQDAPFPHADENGPPQLPARVRHGNIFVDITHWGDNRDATGRDNVKFWAGAGGYPGAAFVRDALDAVRGKILAARDDPFNLSALLGSNLRLDWRGGYIPLDAGFSLNKHGHFESVSFPLVEVLAAIGLSHARPLRVEKLEYRYGVIAAPRRSPDSLVPLPLLRVALGAVPLPFPQRTFTMHLGWAGQEGQARAITSSIEEFSP